MKPPKGTQCTWLVSAVLNGGEPANPNTTMRDCYRQATCYRENGVPLCTQHGRMLDRQEAMRQHVARQARERQAAMVPADPLKVRPVLW